MRGIYQEDVLKERFYGVFGLCFNIAHRNQGSEYQKNGRRLTFSSVEYFT